MRDVPLRDVPALEGRTAIRTHCEVVTESIEEFSLAGLLRNFCCKLIAWAVQVLPLASRPTRDNFQMGALTPFLSPSSKTSPPG